jgi:hypothetical protein
MARTGLTAAATGPQSLTRVLDVLKSQRLHPRLVPRLRGGGRGKGAAGPPWVELEPRVTAVAQARDETRAHRNRIKLNQIIHAVNMQGQRKVPRNTAHTDHRSRPTPTQSCPLFPSLPHPSADPANHIAYTRTHTRPYPCYIVLATYNPSNTRIHAPAPGTLYWPHETHHTHTYTPQPLLHCMGHTQPSIHTRTCPCTAPV